MLTFSCYRAVCGCAAGCRQSTRRFHRSSLTVVPAPGRPSNLTQRPTTQAIHIQTRLDNHIHVYYCTSTHWNHVNTADPFLFSINTGSTEPIYRQLVEQVRRRIAGGQLSAGQELPSVRELAQALAVHPMTISKAYSLLEAEGLLERRRGLAMRVAAEHSRAQSAASRVELLRPSLERAAAEARQLELPSAQAIRLFKKILDEGTSA